MKVKINNRKTVNYFFIIIIGIVLSIPLFSNKLNIYYGDGFRKVAESYEFTKNFSFNEGKILTSFFGNIGTGNVLLESPLAIILLFIGNYIFESYIVAYKIIIFCSIVLSGYYMHKYTDKLTQNKNIALFSAILYMSVPLHISELYIHNSLNNCLIFVFIPMIFLGLYRLFNTTEHSFHFGLGVIGLVLTDLKIFFIFLPIIIAYFVINYKNLELERVKKDLIINILAIISITSFFIFPYIQTNLYTDYVESNYSKQDFLDSRVSIKSLFVTSDNSYCISELGPHIIILFAISLICMHMQKDEEEKDYKFNLIVSALYIYFSLKLFPWGLFPNWISKIENANNFLIVAMFFICVICGMNIDSIVKKFGIKDICILSIIAILFISPLNEFIPFVDEIRDINSYDYSQIIEKRVLPKKAKKNIDYLRGRSREVEVLKGEAEITDKNKILTHYNFKSNTTSEMATYELPYLYYPGYDIRYDGIHMDYFESEHGLIAVNMEKEDGTHFEVNYVGTKIMNITKVISFVSLICFGIYAYKKR